MSEINHNPEAEQLPEKRPVGRPPKRNDIQALLASDTFKQKVALALPKHCTPDRFVRVACNALLRTPKLMQCSQTSLMKALLDLSTFGLEPDGRRAHLIPFGDEVQLILDYKGIVELVRRSGDVSYIHADVVREGDFFDYQQGTDAKLVHRPLLKRNPDADDSVYAAYSFIRLKDGSQDFDVMSLLELEAIRRRSKTYNAKTDTNEVQTSRGLIPTPWDIDRPEMYKKSIFKRHSKWQNWSPQVRSALDYEDENDPIPVRGIEIAKPVFDAPKTDLSFLTPGEDAEEQGTSV